MPSPSYFPLIAALGFPIMATGLIYAMPPAAIYYAFKRYMVGGLTAGAVKS